MTNLRVMCINGSVIDFNNVKNIRKIDNIIIFDYKKDINDSYDHYKEAYFYKNQLIGFYEF